MRGILLSVLFVSALAGCSAVSTRLAASVGGASSTDPSWRSIPEADLRSLIGLPLADARTRLAELGHRGEIAVDVLPGFAQGCGGQGTVCDWEPTSVSRSAPIRLKINPRANIPLPPD